LNNKFNLIALTLFLSRHVKYVAKINKQANNEYANYIYKCDAF